MLNWRTRSSKIKAQIIGALAGAIFTIGVVVFHKVSHPRYFDPSVTLLGLTFLPTAVIYNLVGLPLNLFGDNGAGGSSNQWAIFPLCLAVIINSLLFCLLGRLVGVLIKENKTKE